MNRPNLLNVALPVALLLAAAPVHGQTWTGFTSTDWNTASNWNPATVPNSLSVPVTFGNAGVGTVNISSSVSANSVNFTNTSGSYTLTSSANQTLTVASGITMAAGVTQTIYVDLASLSTGSLLFPSGINLTVANNSTAGALWIAANGGTVIGTPGNGGVVFAGPGSTVFYGSFATSAPPNNQVRGGLTKTGPGSFDYGGDGSNLYGGLTLNGGYLNLDFSVISDPKLGSGALTLGGGVLEFSPTGNGALSQTIPGGTTVSAGHTDIVQGNGGAGTLTFGLGAISRSAGATIDVSTDSGIGVVYVTTTTDTTNSLLGTGPAFATVGGGSKWATKSGSSIVGLTSYAANAYSAGANTDVNNSATLPNGTTTNSLRFNTGNQTLTLSGSLTLQSGGILVTPSASGGTITGGTLNATGNGELIVHQYSNGTFTINSALVSAVGLTKTGPGTLVLSGSNTGLGGPINVNRGNLTVTSFPAISNVSAINFNDDRTGNDLQQFTADFGYNHGGSIFASIGLSAFSPTDYGTYFSTGSSTGASATLYGVISSAPGLTTPIRFTGEPGNTSGFYLTNTNTFTGNVSLQHGFLDITSDASLGNAANTLYLEVGDNNNGGLVFLNGGVNVARPISLTSNTRIVSNGTDSSTISGPISGMGGLVKAGTGTLTITNGGNSYGGATVVTGGTLALGSATALPAGSNITVQGGGVFNTGGFFNTPGTAIGTLALNGGGTLRIPSGADISYYLNVLTTDVGGGTVDMTGTTTSNGIGVTLAFVNAGAGITVNGNSLWTGPNSAAIVNDTGAQLPITIAPVITLSSGLGLAGAFPTIASNSFLVTGGGTLYLTQPAYYQAFVRVSQSALRMDDVSSLVPGFFNLTLDNGALQYGGPTGSATSISLAAGGGTVSVLNAPTTLTFTGAITGPGGLTKSGPGTLVLANSGNSFTNLTINAGTVQTANDNTLGAGPIAVGPFGTMLYTASTTTSRTFSLNSGTLAVAAGQTLTLQAAAVGGGFLRGPGTFTVTGGTVFTGTTIGADAVVKLNGAGSFVNVSHSGTMTVPVAASVATPVFSSFINEGSGSITLFPQSAVNVSQFQTYGVLTINPATVTETFSQTSLMTNVGSTQLFFNGGSRTFVGTPSTAVFPSNWPDQSLRGLPTFVAGIDLHGQNATVAGGLFVNNGYVEDTTNNGQGTAAVIADFGSLVKGAGYFQNSVQTINGGKFQAGNSPGSASFGKFVLGPGGVSNYVFAIDDATGAAGPSPDATGHVSGWGLVKSISHMTGAGATPGDFTWTATPADKLLVSLETLLNPTTVGVDVPGPMDHFDPTRSYIWPAVEWTGAYAGPTGATMLDASTNFDTSGFANPVAGTFGWGLDLADHTLLLAYSPSAVPEPGSLALASLAFGALVYQRKWIRRRPGR